MAIDSEWLDRLLRQEHPEQWNQGWTIPVHTPRRLGTMTTEGTMDTQKVVTALAERLGLTIDHKSDLVEARPGKPWGGDSFTPTNFAKVREDLDDMQEIVMGLTKYLGVEVTVEDGRKVTVTPPPEDNDVDTETRPTKGRKRSKRNDPF